MTHSEAFYPVFIDCLPSPTHLFSGISPGNVASEKNQFSCSHPKKAALESLEKMRKVSVHSHAVQLVVPPIPRPDLVFLESLGFPPLRFSKKTHKELPFYNEVYSQEFRKASSSSAMWTANWAHMTPACDTEDRKLHISIANLAAFSHRYLETGYIEALLKNIFKNTETVVHKALPPSGEFHDEGAANDIHLSNHIGNKGLTLSVWGRNTPFHPTIHYPARQTLQACQAIQRRHNTSEGSYFFLQQNPEAIDAGVFHNDVISFGGSNILICHEKSYVNQKEALKALQMAFNTRTGEELSIVEIPESELPLQLAVESYFFNSQLIIHPDRSTAPILFLPLQCKNIAYITSLIASVFPQIQTEYIDLSESMKNGGGPACLRFQLNMPQSEIMKLPENVRLTPQLFDELSSTIQALYPERISLEDMMSDKHCFLSLLKAEEAIAILLGLDEPWRQHAKKIGLGRYISRKQREDIEFKL